MDTKVSIIMSAFNSEKYIKNCINSILSQTFTDFELLVFDDCSEDSTVAIIESYYDERIKLFKNSENKGLTKNLNEGIRIAKGKYIARIDSDDICCLNRLKIQYDYMESHPFIDVLGSNAYLISMDNRLVGRTREALKTKDISEKIKIFNPFLHPTVMIRADKIKANLYNEEFRTCQDYELWVRMQREWNYESIKTPLIYYRLNTDGATRSARKNLEKRMKIIRPILTRSLEINNVRISEDELEALLEYTLQMHNHSQAETWEVIGKTLGKKGLNSASMYSIKYFSFAFLIKHAFRILLWGYSKLFVYYLGIVRARLNSSVKKELLEICEKRYIKNEH